MLFHGAMAYHSYTLSLSRTHKMICFFSLSCTLHSLYFVFCSSSPHASSHPTELNGASVEPKLEPKLLTNDRVTQTARHHNTHSSFHRAVEKHQAAHLCAFIPRDGRAGEKGRDRNREMLARRVYKTEVKPY